MVSVILVASGLFAAAYGTWRGYAAARGALGPFLHEGEPTRTLVERAQPVHARSRVRLAARQVVVAVAWVSVALYGLYLVTVGSMVGA